MKKLRIDWLSIRRNHWKSRVEVWMGKMLERVGHPDFLGFSESWREETQF